MQLSRRHQTEAGRSDRRLREFLRIGYDVFISYARSDAQAYAQALFLRLADRGLAPFIDAVATSPGAHTPPSVLRKLRRSSMLVVIGSAGSTTSHSMKEEIELFARTGRNIVLIDIDGAATTAVWYDLVTGLPAQMETLTGISAGTPSHRIVEFVLSTADFTRRAVRLRRAVIVASVLAVALIASGLLISNLIIADAQRIARDLGLLAEARGHAESDPYLAVCALAAMSQLNEADDAMQEAFEVLQRPKSIAAARLHSAIVTHVSFDSSGKWVLTTSNDGKAVLWRWRTDQRVEMKEHKSDIRLAARSADGRWIMTAGTAGAVYLRDTHGKVLNSTHLNGWPRVGAF